MSSQGFYSECKSAVPSLGVPNPKFVEQKFRRVNATGGPKSESLRAKFLACRTQNDCRVNGALMSAPEENSLFCFPMFSERSRGKH
jgi:SH3-like domain-containing protein